MLAKHALSQLSYGPFSQRPLKRRAVRIREPWLTNAKAFGASMAQPAPPVCRALKMVGPGRLELPTSRLSGVRSNHLSYGPQPQA
jgi:hypothetical protein